MKNIFIFIGLYLASFNAPAQWIPASSSTEWSPDSFITKLYPTTNGLIFNISSTNTAASSCDSGSRFFISTGHSNYHVIVGAIMLAFNEQHKVSLHILEPSILECAKAIDRLIIKN